MRSYKAFGIGFCSVTMFPRVSYTKKRITMDSAFDGVKNSFRAVHNTIYSVMKDQQGTFKHVTAK